MLILGRGGIISVVRIDGTNVGDGGGKDNDPKPGPVFRILRKMLAAGELIFLCSTTNCEQGPTTSERWNGCSCHATDDCRLTLRVAIRG